MYAVDNTTNQEPALHREQDEAQMKRQPIKLSDPDAFERTRAAMGTYVPKPGERVRIDQCEGLPYYEGKIRMCVAASLTTNGEVRMFADWPGSGGEAYALLCRVSPLPASPIDVECPHAAARVAGAPRLCEGSTGRGCTNMHSGAPYPRGKYHADRSAHFLALTGGKDSGTIAQAREPTNGAGPSVGDSGTGRAAGELASGRLVKKPAAQSGFKPPRDATDPERWGNRKPRPRGPQANRPCACRPGLACVMHHANTRLDHPLPKPDALRTWPERAGEDYEL